MRWIVASTIAALGAAGCSSKSSGEYSTSGPIESIVHFEGDAVGLHAAHHKLALADLKLDRWLGGLPLDGTIELGANLRIPLAGTSPDLRHAAGKLAVRCLGHCRLGDDHTRLMPTSGRAARDAFYADGLAFSHLDLDGLEAHVTVAGGHARLTDWKLASPDLDLLIDADLTLGHGAGDSTIDACIRFRPTDALKARDPSLYNLFELTGATRGPDGRSQIHVTGSLAAPRMLPAVCNETP